MDSITTHPLKKNNTRKVTLPLAPASFFAMTLGFAETGNAWRNATLLWHAPALVGEIFQALAMVSFVWWLVVYVNKWIQHADVARQEFKDPVQASFLALIPESIILMALAIFPYSYGAAVGIFWVGSMLNIFYGAYRLAGLWMHERTAEQTTPSLFLTYTASILVNALVAGVLGYTHYGFALMGIGTISWLIMDSVVTQQLTVGGLAAKTRNFMGIYMAPSVVIFVAYQVLTQGKSDLHITYALAGYAIFIFIALTFAFGWLREQAFAPGYWAYTFGIATLSQGMSLLASQVGNLWIDALAFAFFLLTNVVIIAVTVGSVRLLMKGSYFPK